MTRPNIQIPKEFAINGEKADFTQEKMQTGFDKLNPDIFAGDNINKFIDDTYKGLNGVLDLYNGVVLHEMTTTYDDKAVVGKFIENSFKLYRSLVNDNTGHEVTETEYWEEVALGGGGSGFNLFDTKISDHILEGDEALGWALQGTYVYKEGVAGSRTGYADFYNRCVEEYNNSILEGINTGTTYTQPVNPTGITATSGWTNAIDAFDGNASTYAFCGTTTDYIEWDLGQTLFISGFSATGNWVSGSAHASDLNIYKVNDDGSETLIAKGTGHSDSDTYTTSATFTTVGCTKIRFRLNETATSGTQAPVRIRDIKITATLGIEILVNNNKHKFYPISQKPYIDSIYESTGTAWFYGIDTENERIFLPRETARYLVEKKEAEFEGDTWYNLYSDGWCEQGGITAPNATITFLKPYKTVDDYQAFVTPQTKDSGTNPSVAYINNKNAYSMKIGGNWTTCWQTEGYTNIPTNLPKYKYICVGNTKVESAISNVTEITTSENDTLPLFYNFYSKEDMTTTGAYVNASLGSWLSGNVYTTAYNELVNKLGTDNVKANTDTYTDYDFVVNQDEMSFRLPLKNGQEVMFATGVKGNGKTLGLTNGDNNFGVRVTQQNTTSYINLNPIIDLYGTDAGSTTTSSTGPTLSKSVGITTDSSKSGIVIDTENITIPDGWNLYYKLSNAVTNLELLDVAKVTNDLNTCYKRNAGDNSDLSGLGMPSNKSIDLELGASGTIYTAPANGWFYLSRTSTGSSQYISLVGQVATNKIATGSGQLLQDYIPVAKGHTVNVTYNAPTASAFKFYYAEGEV